MRKRVIRAGEIEIEDSEGRVRARFGVTNDDLPFLSFYGPDDKLRARFGVQPDGSAGLAIADDDGKVRATFGLFSDGSASMAMVDKNGKVRAKFGLGTEGSPTLALRNKDGESLWTAPGTLPGGKAGRAGADDTAASPPEGTANP